MQSSEVNSYSYQNMPTPLAGGVLWPCCCCGRGSAVVASVVVAAAAALKLSLDFGEIRKTSMAISFELFEAFFHEQYVLIKGLT